MTAAAADATIERGSATRGVSPDGRFGEVTDPATGTVVRHVPFGEEADVAVAQKGIARWGRCRSDAART